MARRVLDPEAIREFARTLREFCNDTQQNLDRVQGRLDDVGRSDWVDSTQRVFQEEFESSADGLRRILSQFDHEMSSRLEQLANQAEEIEY